MIAQRSERNKNLKTVMFKFDITQDRIAKLLKISLPTVNKKLNNSSFTQEELSIILTYLQGYDNSITADIFFATKVN